MKFFGPSALGPVMLALVAAGCTADRQTTDDAETPAYVISEISIEDPAGYEEYLQEVDPIIAKFGGVALISSSDSRVEVIEGAPLAGQFTVLQFPDAASRDAFWSSPEYAAIKHHRFENASSRILHADGYAPADRKAR